MQGIDRVGRNERDTDKRCHKTSGARRASNGDEWTIIANSSAAKSHTWKRRLGSQRESNLRYIIKNRMKSLLLHNDRIKIVYLPIWLSQTIRRRDAILRSSSSAKDSHSVQGHHPPLCVSAVVLPLLGKPGTRLLPSLICTTLVRDDARGIRTVDSSSIGIRRWRRPVTNSWRICREETFN